MKNGTDGAGNLKGHTHPPMFGKKVSGCDRCEALSSGAQPVRWHSDNDKRHLADVRSHFASERHLSGDCGPVCTFGEW